MEVIDLKIRIATLNDIESICLLNQEFWSYNAGLQGDYYSEAKDNGDYPKSVITNEDSDILLAEENNEVVGFIHVRESKTPPYPPIVQHKYAEIIDLIVTASYRRKGTDSLLMNAAKEWSMARNLDYIELFVLSDAKGEKLFYEQYGFNTVSHTMRYTL